MPLFKLNSDFQPTGDQPKAIDGLRRHIKSGEKHSLLLGVTGSGKTFTMAKVIEDLDKPSLVLAHNKTLAAQLYHEFKTFFPDNAVEYFVSYYDYYQPEAYLPATDTYIEKDSSINEDIDKLRLSATRSLFERRDVIIVASVSCIYGLGSPEAYYGMLLLLKRGMNIEMEKILRKLVDILYARSPNVLERGQFRARGDVIEVFPSYDDSIVRIEMFDEAIEKILIVDSLTGEIKREIEQTAIYPKNHFVTPRELLLKAVEGIKVEMRERVAFFEGEKRLLEAQRISQRCAYDIELLVEMGHCTGIENYSRHLTGRMPGQPPPTLMDYLPDDSIVFIDESHQTVPQIRGMYNGDHSRKQTLVEFGFRLPSALDNRPLKFDEFMKRVPQCVYVSATPSDWEIEVSKGITAEQVIRPTGLMDPVVEVRPVKGQIDNLISEIKKRAETGERTLVTTLTKKMAEELSSYLKNEEIKTAYLHSDIETLERVKILRDLRKGVYDVLIGVNLLREGLDLPEVSLVAILDADKEGFLRSKNSLIQTIGRAARHVSGKAILYADRMTAAINSAMNETNRRREKQRLYNERNGITPQSIIKSIDTILSSIFEKDYYGVPQIKEEQAFYGTEEDLEREIRLLEKKMREAAEKLEFEDAASFRDRILALKNMVIFETV